MPHKDRVTRVRVCVCLCGTVHACQCVNARARLSSHSSSPLPRDLLFPFPWLGLPPGSEQWQQQRALPPQRPTLTRSVRARSPLRSLSLHQSGSVGKHDHDSCTAICELHLLIQGKEEVNLSFLFKSGRQSTLSTHSVLFVLSFF